MKHVYKFQSDDGQLHDDKGFALIADADHALNKGIEQLIENNVAYTDYQSTVSTFMKDCREQLEKLFVQHHNDVNEARNPSEHHP